MGTAFKDVDASELAAWLEGPDVRHFWWTVEDDYDLTGALALPCSGADLAIALRKHGGRIRLFGSQKMASLASLAEADDDGALVFSAAWLDDQEAAGERWTLAQDLLAQRVAESA